MFPLGIYGQKKELVVLPSLDIQVEEKENI